MEENNKILTDEQIERAINTQAVTFPMTSEYIGNDTLGNPIYDRAIGAEELSEFDKEIFKDGIFGTNSNYYKVTSNNNLSVTVNFGKAYIQGYKVWHKLTKTLTVNPATTTRKDIVVLRLDLNDNVRDTVIAIKQGTTTLTRTSSIWELKLAELNVRASSSQILTSDITDTRLDSTVCGFSANNFTTFDTTSFYTQLNSSLTTFNTNSSNAISTFNTNSSNQLTSQQNQFNSWFSTAQSSLLTFDFDNKTNFLGMDLTTTFSADGTITEIYKNNNVEYAKRITQTTATSPEKIMKVTTTCSAKNVNNTITITFKTDGTITESVRSNVIKETEEENIENKNYFEE